MKYKNVAVFFKDKDVQPVHVRDADDLGVNALQYLVINVGDSYSYYNLSEVVHYTYEEVEEESDKVTADIKPLNVVPN